MNDNIEAYGPDGLRSDAKRLHDAATKVTEAEDALADAQDNLDDAKNEQTNVISEVRGRLEETHSVWAASASPDGFNPNYPRVDDAIDQVISAQNDPTPEAIDEIADAMGEAADRYEQNP